MAFKEGDFVEIEYSSWTAADGRMIDTSDQKIAEKNGILVEGRSYGPSLAILGKRTVLKGLDDALMEMNEGQSKKLTLKPDQAFGERNPEMMKVMPLAEFRKRDIAPYPGMRVDIDNIKATVKSVSSGRVVVDANHPYAGLDIIYEVKVLRKLNQEQEKIAALGGVYGVTPTSTKVNGKAIEMEFSDTVKKDADYFIGKTRLVTAIFEYFKDVEKVRIGEEYDRLKEEVKRKEEEHDHENED